MKKKVIVTINAGLLQEIRELGAREGKSVSALLAEDLRRIVVARKDARKTYRCARMRARARLGRGVDLRLDAYRIAGTSAGVTGTSLCRNKTRKDHAPGSTLHALGVFLFTTSNLPTVVRSLTAALPPFRMTS
jgi:hypothetical protein